jgi:hypothetical protein
MANGTASCNGTTCELTCDVGYSLSGGFCIADTTCSNGIKDNAETDVDCGGDLCGSCSDGQLCIIGSDCASGVCNGTCSQISP